jgi:hypothetical protein
MRECDSSSKAGNLTRRFGSNAPEFWREPAQARLRRRHHPYKPSDGLKDHANVVEVIFDGVHTRRSVELRNEMKNG